MSGAPGSGKSTIALRLARSIDGIVINHDLLKSFFLDTNTPFDQAAKLAYNLDWVLAEDLLKQGRSVIIDSVCNYATLLEKGAAVAEQHGCAYRFVECRVEDVEVLDRRLRGRVAMRSQRTGIDVPPADAAGTGGVGHRAVLKRKMENPVHPASGAIVVDSSGICHHPPQRFPQFQLPLVSTFTVGAESRASEASAQVSASPMPAPFPVAGGFGAVRSSNRMQTPVEFIAPSPLFPSLGVLGRSAPLPCDTGPGVPPAGTNFHCGAALGTPRLSPKETVACLWNRVTFVRKRMAGRREETGRGMKARDNSRVGEREKRGGLLAGKSSGKMIALWERKRMIAS
ncbi:hypothetical protein V500_07494 [Pseudogymnoascus sp. VKM F-4518 (FW-2643)]|nr:hypothetical protein V500_07494 [Pseudogymnoascus sp. VKM F-4518 (FW-2643)]